MDVGRSQIEWNMKVKIEISICTGLMLNDHSNPYVESTTVLSDTIFLHPLRIQYSNYNVKATLGACAQGNVNHYACATSARIPRKTN